ncbi:MAG TPA: two-component regulator propeller domain-containing protein, partial [Bacillota bacterium]|nr:two-component regulator propeller domain-containing protein [Bacillota bacterium]
GWRGPDQTCWAASIDSLFQWEPARPEISQNEEISARQYFDLALEPSGAFWLATSDGLFRYAPLAWRSPEPVRRFNGPVHGLTADPEGRLWFVCGSSLYGLLNGQLQEYPFPPTLARVLQNARSLFWLKNGALMLEAGERLFQFEPRRRSFGPLQPEQPARPLKVLGTLKDGTPCVQFLNPDGSGQECCLQKFQGNRFQAIAELAPAPSMATNLQVLFSAQNGDLWVGGELGTACYHEKKWRTFVSTDKSNPEGVLAFAELSDGRIWCATRDQVWEFDNRNWSVVRRGFDRINALVHARDGSVWVASNSGVIRFFQGAWVENGVEEGLPGAAVREIFEDPRGGLWAGTTRGLSLFHPEADSDPPRTSIDKLAENENNLPAGTAVTLTFSGQDRWKYTARERLLYSYRLDEHDWSPFQEANHVSFLDLAAGKHYFQVRALDRNGNMESEPAKREFVIVLPWYKETRLVLISFAGLTGALFFAGLAFNRHRQLLRSYAEVGQKVAERTRELELANRELLHSQKMNALGTLAAGIAHDFNNILSIIKGSAQLIEENLENPDKIRTRAERIRTVVEQGSGIVKAMLGFSRDSDQQLALCDLNAVVEDTTRLLGDRFLREVQVRFEGSPGLPPVPVLKDFVQQIL